MSPPPSWPRARVALLLAFVSLLLYAPALGAFFLSDDFVLLEAVREGGPFGYWSGGAGGDFFRPLVPLTIWLDDVGWGGRAPGFHLTNILLHIINAFLVVVVARRLASSAGSLPRDATRLSVTCGLVFAALSCHTEAVSWISGRTDLLATLFALGAIASYLGNRLWVACGLFMIALLAKESVVALPLVALAYEFWPRSQGVRATKLGRWRGPGALFGVVAAYLAVRLVALGTLGGGYGSAVHMERNPLLIGVNLAIYTFRVAFPPVPNSWLPPGTSPLDVRRAGLDALRAVSPSSLVLVLLAALAVVAVAVVLLRRARRTEMQHTPSVLWAFPMVAYLLSLVPVINLRVSFLNTEGERLLYLPSAFFALAVVFGVRRWVPGRVVGHALLVVLCVVGAAGAIQANLNWAAAGRMARMVLADFKSADTTGRVLVTSLPDNLGGAYIFRNGFHAAVRAFDAPPTSTASIGVWSIMLTATDATMLQSHAAGYRLELGNSRARFVHHNRVVDAPIESDTVRLVPVAPTTVDLFPKPGAFDAVLAFSEGRLRQLSFGD